MYPLVKIKICGIVLVNSCRSGGMADTMDSKSIVSNDMWVRLPPPVLYRVEKISARFFYVGV